LSRRRSASLCRLLIAPPICFSDETEHQRSHYGLKTGLSTEFNENFLGMGFDRLRSYAEPLCHTLVGVPQTDELKNDVFTRAEMAANWVAQV